MQQTTTKANDDNDTSKQSELILAKAKCKHIGDPAFAIVTTGSLNNNAFFLAFNHEIRQYYTAWNI